MNYYVNQIDFRYNYFIINGFIIIIIDFNLIHVINFDQEINVHYYYFLNFLNIYFI